MHICKFLSVVVLLKALTYELVSLRRIFSEGVNFINGNLTQSKQYIDIYYQK